MTERHITFKWDGPYNRGHRVQRIDGRQEGHLYPMHHVSDADGELGDVAAHIFQQPQDVGGPIFIYIGEADLERAKSTVELELMRQAHKKIVSNIKWNQNNLAEMGKNALRLAEEIKAATRNLEVDGDDNS